MIGGPATLRGLARAAGFYGGLGAGFGVGAGVAALRRSRGPVLDIGGAIGSDLGLALAGVDVAVVEGREHLWSARPCVFVFNHQSNIDPIVVMKLVRGGITGVAKKEAKRIPVFGLVFTLAGVAFVDRGDTDQARRALAPAVEKLRAGTSLIIAPEGTRSATPRLGRFKKGAFHIALQAAVPMVPIVLRNTGEVMARGTHLVTSGRIDVAVLPPVDTATWSADTLDRHVDDVRRRFAETLEHWPTR
jgi:putative phosphoserine phosphatase/1-acylglycerol-3-phosphate O-acyltransferase